MNLVAHATILVMQVCIIICYPWHILPTNCSTAFPSKYPSLDLDIPFDICEIDARMESFSGADEAYATANSRLLPTELDPPQPSHGKMRIMEPHGPGRRPKSGDFKLLAGWVAMYVNVLIPKEDYHRFVNARGEREWKRTLRSACDLEWRPGDTRDFNDIRTQDYIAMRDFVARAWPFTKHFDGYWIIKWALRSTWTNRKKASARAEKGTSSNYPAI